MVTTEGAQILVPFNHSVRAKHRQNKKYGANEIDTIKRNNRPKKGIIDDMIHFQNMISTGSTQSNLFVALIVPFDDLSRGTLVPTSIPPQNSDRLVCNGTQIISDTPHGNTDPARHPTALIRLP